MADYELSDVTPKRTQQNTLLELDSRWCDPDGAARMYDIVRRENRWLMPSAIYIDLQELERSPKAVLAAAQPFFGPTAEWALDYVQRLGRRFPSFLADGGRYMEFWIRIHAAPMRNVLMHVDSFNYQFAGVEPDPPLRLPVWGSLYHLGPTHGMKGGSTFVAGDDPGHRAVFKEHMFEWRPLEVIQGLDMQWIEVPSKANRLTIFRGDLPHFMGPIYEVDPERPRIAVAVNGWDASLPTECLTFKDGIGALVTAEEIATLQRINLPDLITLGRVLDAMKPEELYRLRRFMP